MRLWSSSSFYSFSTCLLFVFLSTFFSSFACSFLYICTFPCLLHLGIFLLDLSLCQHFSSFVASWHYSSSSLVSPSTLFIVYSILAFFFSTCLFLFILFLFYFFCFLCKFFLPWLVPFFLHFIQECDSFCILLHSI
jgi:hypothetical protein